MLTINRFTNAARAIFSPSMGAKGLASGTQVRFGQETPAKNTNLDGDSFSLQKTLLSLLHGTDDQTPNIRPEDYDQFHHEDDGLYSACD